MDKALARLDDYLIQMIDTFEQQGQTVETIIIGGKPRFQIETKEHAIWALRKIAAIERARKEAQEAAQAEIYRIQDWLAGEEKRADQAREYLDMLLEDYHRRVLAESPKMKTIKLPHGELQIRKQQPEYVKSDDAVKVWAKENRPELLVPQEPKLDWATLKKSLQATGDGRAVDVETGTVVPSVAITERPPKFTIKLTGV
ncbi:host-nuclease inhibitor Gam family protein [Desulfallas thermosapovorans]|uniref:Gam-like protein n=1 Tax=Desulfallas thermosapovorans DSM 6562 TaxID=1121431 RepID=A0A5S4ZSW0_9FIRM|nr:host-nuclease inhibitor Gam family protein [Desulfallas thermosapovorans]TYO95151.1 Gam-like protein [Desulfallas thermosapovorans DSM 6562]